MVHVVHAGVLISPRTKKSVIFFDAAYWPLIRRLALLALGVALILTAMAVILPERYPSDARVIFGMLGLMLPGVILSLSGFIMARREWERLYPPGPFDHLIGHGRRW